MHVKCPSTSGRTQYLNKGEITSPCRTPLFNRDRIGDGFVNLDLRGSMVLNLCYVFTEGVREFLML